MSAAAARRFVGPALGVLVFVAVLGIWQLWAGAEDSFSRADRKRGGRACLGRVADIGLPVGRGAEHEAATSLGSPSRRRSASRSASWSGHLTPPGGRSTPSSSVYERCPRSPSCPPRSIVLGFGDASRIVVIAFGLCFPILVNTAEGVRGIPLEVRDTASMLHVGRVERLARIYLPAALPSIMAGLRFAVSLGLVLVIVSEFVGEANGLGYYLRVQQSTARLPRAVRGHPLPRPARVRAQPALPDR